MDNERQQILEICRFVGSHSKPCPMIPIEQVKKAVAIVDELARSSKRITVAQEQTWDFILYGPSEPASVVDSDGRAIYLESELVLLFAFQWRIHNAVPSMKELAARGKFRCELGKLGAPPAPWPAKNLLSDKGRRWEWIMEKDKDSYKLIAKTPGIPCMPNTHYKVVLQAYKDRRGIVHIYDVWDDSEPMGCLLPPIGSKEYWGETPFAVHLWVKRLTGEAIWET